MSVVDLAELRAEMETEREWREREMRLFRNQVAALSSEDQRRIARKALVVMLYAHFEGVTKALLSMYVNRINALSLRISDVAPSLGAAALSDIFHALRDAKKKCKEFARSLPDDTALHRFARDREFVEIAWQIAARTVQIDTDELVDTESNLKPVVLKKILFRIGLDPNLMRPWESVIHQLLNRRNDVAHGTAKNGLEEKDYTALEQAVNLVVDDIVKAICDAVAKQFYLATTASAPTKSTTVATPTSGSTAP